MAKIKVLGIDPSLASTGWAVAQVDTNTRKIESILAMGTIVTEKTKSKQVRKSSDDMQRARTIFKTLSGVIAEHGIKIATSEIPGGAQSASAARAFGIVVGLMASLPVPVIEVNPTEVKLAATNTKFADKEDMVRWAVGLTTSTQSPVEWNTGKAANDWNIQIEDRYVTKTMEHQADAIGALNAAVKSTQFEQLAGMLESLL